MVIKQLRERYLLIRDGVKWADVPESLGLMNDSYPSVSTRHYCLTEITKSFIVEILISRGHFPTELQKCSRKRLHKIITRVIDPEVTSTVESGPDKIGAIAICVYKCSLFYTYV